MKKKPKKVRSRTLPDQVMESGLGYSEVLTINVSWTVSRIGGLFVWAWQAHKPELAAELGLPLSDSSAGFEKEEEAAGALDEALALQTLPKPDPDPDPDPDPEPEGQPGLGLPPPPPPGPGPGPAIPTMGFSPPPEPPPLPPPVALFAVEVYPPAGDKTKLPPMTTNDGLVVSADGTVAGIGPMFWDRVGERVEQIVGGGAEDQNTIMQILAEEFFPVVEIHLYPAAMLIYNEMGGRVQTYLGA